MRALLTELLATYGDGIGINRTEGHDLPNVKIVRQTLLWLFDILFPGFSVSGHPVTADNLEYHIGDLLNHVAITLTGEVERAFRYDCKTKQCATCRVQKRAQKTVRHFLQTLPQVRLALKSDVTAGYNGDPAATSFDEVIISYPSMLAVGTYRLAHELYRLQVPLIPRIWTEYAHNQTGIDIHPGAVIGKSFFIDHGTGVVIGETCAIGDYVQLYQGVTLGALAPAEGQKLRSIKRHPTIRDHVVIYAGATILGGDTVIGEHSTIGGNVWLTNSVASHSKVLLARDDLLILNPQAKTATKIVDFSCPAKPLCDADGASRRHQARN